MCDGRCDDASDVELALSSVIQTIRVNPTNGVDVKIAKWGDGALLVDLATTNKIGWIQEAVRVCGEAEYVLGEGKSYSIGKDGVSVHIHVPDDSHLVLVDVEGAIGFVDAHVTEFRMCAKETGLVFVNRYKSRRELDDALAWQQRKDVACHHLKVAFGLMNEFKLDALIGRFATAGCEYRMMTSENGAIRYLIVQSRLSGARDTFEFDENGQLKCWCESVDDYAPPGTRLYRQIGGSLVVADDRYQVAKYLLDVATSCKTNVTVMVEESRKKRGVRP